MTQIRTVMGLLASVALATPLRAQTLTGAAKWADSARREIEAGYIAGDLERMNGARVLLERALTVSPNDALLLHYKGYELYREETMREANGDVTTRNQMLAAARDALERSDKASPMPETRALLALVYGRQIAADPSIKMTLGYLASETMDGAVQIGEKNPRVWLLRGVNAIFAPVQYGGGLDVAEQYLRKAIELFASDRPAPPAPAWGRGEVYAWLGQVYQKQNKRDAAREAYMKALEAEPNNAWVRTKLLPALGQ